MRVFYIFISFLFNTFQEVIGYDDITGDPVTLSDISSMEQVLLYSFYSDPCLKCAEDIVNYSIFRSDQKIPPMLVFTLDSKEEILKGIDLNKNSPLKKHYKRSYILIPFENKVNVFEHLNAKEINGNLLNGNLLLVNKKEGLVKAVDYSLMGFLTR